jgi:hypothetical protein
MKKKISKTIYIGIAFMLGCASPKLRLTDEKCVCAGLPLSARFDWSIGKTVGEVINVLENKKSIAWASAVQSHESGQYDVRITGLLEVFNCGGGFRVRHAYRLDFSVEPPYPWNKWGRVQHPKSYRFTLENGITRNKWRDILPITLLSGK